MSPDSGAYRGIDSLVVVEAAVRVSTAIDSGLAVFFWLAADGVDSLVIADTTTFNATAVTDSIKTAIGATGTHFTSRAPNSFIAARQPIAGSFTGAIGDGDSIAVKTKEASGADTLLFTWYARIPASAGTISNVRAAAAAWDPTPTAFTSIKTTAGDKGSSVRLDADRPGNGSMVLSAAAVNAGAPSVTGFQAGSGTRQVAGIGDTITLTYNLGDQSDAVILTGDLKLAASILNKTFTPGVPATANSTYKLALAEGNFGDLEDPPSANSDTVLFAVVDKAGNWSDVDPDAVVPQGVTQAIQFVADAKKPSLDAQVKGAVSDTLLPTSNDTITDGGVRAAYDNDINPFTIQLGEALDSLVVLFDGDKDVTMVLAQAGLARNNDALGKTDAKRVIDFTAIGDKGQDTLAIAREGTNTISAKYPEAAAARGDTPMPTGVYTLKATATDVAGNVGPALTRSNVYIDVDDIDLVRLFPTAASGLDTLEEETAKLVFKLSEPADSVLITYRGISGPDDTKSRTRRLSGSQLTNTSSEQTIQVDSLASGTQYVLTVLARDLAGNFTQTSQDTFIYDTTFVVPVIAKFAIAASSSGFGTPILAGAEVTLTLSAQTVDDKAAVTYKSGAILKINGDDGDGLTITGTGVTDEGSGRVTLTADDWIVGERIVKVKDETSIDTLSVSIVDSTDTTSIYAGALDSVIVVNPQIYSQILVSAPDTVTQGEEFMVTVTLADRFGNTRELDDRYVNVSANKLGVMTPAGDMNVEATGMFYAKATTYSGDGLVLTVKDILPANSFPDSLSTLFTGNGAADQGGHIIDGKSDPIYVMGAGDVTLDAPNELMPEDYMGADGAGDQGGFVMLTFDKSDDHETLTAYRIYRELQVNYDVDPETGALVALEEPALAFVPWGKADPVPGEDVCRVLVATLDNVATRWAVAAERGRATTNAKEAFAGTESVATPYELMAQTMVESKAAEVEGPVVAQLTPEALAFIEQGIAPSLKSTDSDVAQSARTVSAEAVKAVDNIAPEAITFLRAVDTPSDAGGSISLTWTKSASDRMLSQTFAQAVGSENTFVTEGVKGYNVYRKFSSNDYEMVGDVPAGQTSFVDASAFNGVRYTYQVLPYDADNLTESELERSAMAIRNQVVTKDGVVVRGLFGQDNKVGFDDFFIFADNFGLGAGDEAFEPAFDLSQNNKVDFDDFFAFADNFGMSVDLAGKVVPMMAGLNTDSRLYLDAGSQLPSVGEEVAIQVSLADFVELKGYGFSVTYDSDVLEFVKVVGENGLLGEAELAQPNVLAEGEGGVSIAAFGDEAAEGDLGVSLVFRTKTEIENSYVELSDGELRDGSYGLNQVASLGSVQIQTRPETYGLFNNYPNPFNPETTIKYQLPEATDVRLEIYNVVGQVVRTMVAGNQNAGRYVVQWDASNDSGQPLSSGIYFYRLQAGEFQDVRKMLLLK